jgi:hypothetical protein
MSLTLAITQISQVGVARQPLSFTLAVTNNSSSAVILTTPQVSESTESDAQISIPQLPGLPIGYIPTLGGNSTLTYTFNVVIASPSWAGFVPQTPAFTTPGIYPSLSLSAPANNAMTPDAFFTLTAQAQASDGSVGTTSLQVLVLSALQPFPPPQGGALQFNAGGNLINGIVSGVL